MRWRYVMSSYSPQDLLDQLHELKIQGFYSSTLSKTDHANAIKLAKQQLRLVKKRLREEQSEITSRWDGRNAREAAIEKIELAPYSLIDDLVGELEIELTKLENGSQDVSNPISFGNFIFGDGQRGGWQIGSRKEFLTWRLKHSEEAYNQFRETMLEARDRLIKSASTANKELKSLQDRLANYKLVSRNLISLIVIWVIITLLVIPVLLLLSNSSGGIILAAGIVTLLITISIFYPLRKLKIAALQRKIEHLQQILSKAKVTLEQLKADLAKEKQTLSTTKSQIKEELTTLM